MRMVLFPVLCLAWLLQAASWDAAQVTAVVLPSEATPAEHFAAAELTRHWRDISGVDLPIRLGSTGEGGIYLRTDALLVPDGYRIAVEEGDLRITGGSGFGLVYGVYAMLEEDLGCRWYEPDYSVLPPLPEKALEIQERQSQPAFPAMRDPNCSAPLNAAWTLANRVSTPWIAAPPELGSYLRYPLQPQWWMSHTAGFFCPPGLFAEHPEYFMMAPDGRRVSDQPCPSHPEVSRLALAKVLEVLRANPQVNIINLSWNDNLEACVCPACQEAMEREGCRGAAFFALVNEVAAGIADEFPRVKLSFLAYYFSFEPPRQMKMAANTVAWVAFLGGRKMYVPVAQQGNFPEVLEGWRQVAPEVHIWDYQVFFPNFFRYEASLASVAENLRFYRDHGVAGVMIQGSYLGPGGERQGLRNWVEAKLLWDPDRDLEALIDDYLQGVFLEAASELRPFYRRLYELELSYMPVDDALPELLELGEACFERAYACAVDNPQLRQRLELEELPLILLRLEREVGLRYRQDGGFSLEAALAELDRAEQIGERAGIYSYGEGRSWKDFLSATRRQCQQKPVYYADVTAPCALVIPAIDGLCYGAARVADMQAQQTEVVLQKANDAMWSWQLPVANLDIASGTVCALRLRCRATLGAGEAAAAFTVTVFDQKANRNLAQWRIPTSEVPQEYQWLSLGEVALTPNCVIYTTTADGVTELRMEALEISSLAFGDK